MLQAIFPDLTIYHLKVHFTLYALDVRFVFQLSSGFEECIYHAFWHVFLCEGGGKG
jgi:hypothetical protein